MPKKEKKVEAEESDFENDSEDQDSDFENDKQQQTPSPDTGLGEETKEPVKAYLIGNKVLVREDFQKAQQYYDKGTFGEIHGVKEKRFEYSLVEALYLLERGRIDLFKDKKKLTFEQFLSLAKKEESDFWTRYQVYRDIRTRGYIVKTALKFGADFRVYRRGVKPGEDHAKWVLFCAAEGDSETWREFAAKNRVAHSTRKRLLIGIVDEEGEVTYYEIRWKKP